MEGRAKLSGSSQAASLHNSEILLASKEATQELGRQIACVLENGMVITLSGQLGAGKTTLVQSIGKGLGIKEVISSPTFTMMNEYHSGRLSVYHFDFYRVMEMAERQEEDLSLDLLAAEFDEICLSSGAVLLIEWPEYFLVEGGNYLDAIDHVALKLKMSDWTENDPMPEDDNDNQRLVRLSSTGARSAVFLERLAEARQS